MQLTVLCKYMMQESRKVSKVVPPNGALTNGGSGGPTPDGGQKEEEEESHCDPTLQRTGRLI